VSIDRQLRGNRTILLIPVIDGPTEPLLVGPDGSTTAFSQPSAALLTKWISVLNTEAVGAQHGGNISCSILDEMTLGLADSDSDDERTICSIGNESQPTFYNVDAEITVFRDKDKADTGVYNLAFQLLNSGRQRYVVLDRIGYKQTDAITIGQDVSLYELRTGTPVDVKEDRGNLKLQQNFEPTGTVNINVTTI
jgi:hypothetical protein